VSCQIESDGRIFGNAPGANQIGLEIGRDSDPQPVVRTHPKVVRADWRLPRLNLRGLSSDFIVRTP
jgi:hypothetical protein